MREKLIELIEGSTGVVYGGEYGDEEICPPIDIFDEEIERIADHLIANGVTIQKWIPVTERLPELETPVLTYRETGPNVELLWQRGCQKRWDYDEFTPYPVTHWMPLPSTEGLE